MRINKLLTIIILSLCTLSSWGVEIYSRKLNTSNGLPENNIRSLAQDTKGYIWMGSPTGLYRYDGYFFTTYKYSDTGNTRLLNNNHISNCYALPDGRMLFSEKGGMYSVFDTNSNLFLDLPVDEMARMYREKRHFEAPEQIKEQFRQVLADGGNCISDNLGNSIVLDRKGHIWFVDRLTGETIPMQVFDEQLFGVISSHKYVVQTSERTGLIWVSTNGSGITVYDRNSREEQHIRQSSGLISTDYIQDICLDSNDNLWVADEFHGVVCLNVVKKQSTTILLEPLSSGLRSNQVRVMHRVNDSLLWVANTQGSAYQADQQLHIRKMMEKVDVHCMATTPDGLTWIGTRTQGLQKPDGSWLTASSSLSSNNVSALLYDEGRLWVGCEDARLDLIDPNGQTTTVRHFLPEAASPKVMLKDQNGYVWVGAKTGLYRFKPSLLMADNTAYEQLLAGADIKYSDVNCIHEDAQGRLWIGTSGDGLYRTDDHGASFTHITMTNGLISDEIQSLATTADGTLWVATTKGITRYRISDGHCQYIYNEHNLQQNFYAEGCVNITPDGRIAFGTNQGIVIYDINTKDEDTRPITMTITDVLVNGESSGPTAGEVTLAHDQNSLTFHFSTFSYSVSTRYSYFLEEYDKQWSEPSQYSFANYKNLPPGRYTLHIKAFDNNTVDTAQQTLTIIIRQPWWKTWWAYLVYLLVAIALGLTIYRQLRIVYNLRRRISIEKELTEYKLQFFTNISHEFRTPLTIIRGAIDRMRTAKDVPADLRQPISNMEHSTNRMLRLINQLLEFRKMQNNKLQLALEDTDIVAFVKDIFQSFSDLAYNKQVNYSFMTNVKTLTMPVDRQHLDKIVYNLLSNALKYTPSKGNVSVGLKQNGQQLIIRVEDSGVGIPKEKQGELFQRFMQSTFSNDSIGIGLHLTKALVDIHHGEISFQENQPTGSVFTVTLPTDRGAYQPDDFIQESTLGQQAVVRENSSYSEVLPEPMNDRTVLVVEDDADVVNFLKQTLNTYFHVEIAMDGQTALEKLQENKPDLILSDVIMPVMDGFELTRRVRSNAELHNIPIILLTALDADEKRLRGIKQGADAYLTKPFDTQLLIATCCRLIEQRDKMMYSTVTAEGAPSQDVTQSSPVKIIAAPEIIVEERDKRLLNAMNTWLYSHLSSPTLSVDELAEAMGYNRSNFFKKAKALTGQTPADYIRTLRMNRAAEMLREETITVAEVCYKVGISDPHYFTKVFKQQFGISPKKYQQGKK